MDLATTLSADEVLARLRAHENELRRAGIRRLSLFGSVARGEAEQDSDVDLAVEFYPAAEMDLFRLAGLQSRLSDIVGGHVDLIAEPIERQRLRTNIERDRLRAF